MKKFAFYQLTNVEDYKEKSVLVMKTEGTNYQVREFGKFDPILNRASDLLLENDLAEILQKNAPNQIKSLEKISIYRKATNEFWENYSVVEFNNTIDFQDFENADSNGIKIYNVRGYLFITSELKQKIALEYKNMNKIEFINKKLLLAG